MHLIYLTAKKYPGSTADHHYIKHLASAFSKNLKEDFTLVVCNTKQDVLKDIPIKNVHVPSWIKRTFVFFVFIPRYWFLELRKEKKQITFFSNDFNLLVILIIWRKVFRLNYKIVSDIHLFTNTWKDRFVIQSSDCSISTSKKLERAINKLSKRTCTKTVYGGVDFEQYIEKRDKSELRKQLSLPKNKNIIGYIGLFTTMGIEKGISTMIDSLIHLSNDNVMVFVGGKNHEIEEYKNYANFKGVLDRCLFISVQPFNMVSKYEQSMDVLVIPYPDKPHFRNYGFPMKVYEYMASGVPIIYSKLELSEEVLSDCAFGFEPGDSEDLADKVNYIINNKEKALIIKNYAFEKVKKYSWETKAQDLLEIFNSL